MTPLSRRLASSFVLTAACAESLQVQGPPRPTPQKVDFGRRGLLAASAAWVVVSPAGPARALKERNEALCGTGFFENIAQYMCTEIGDISDEGKSREIGSEENKSMDSLMGKMGLDIGADVFSNEETTKKPKAKKASSKTQIQTDKKM